MATATFEVRKFRDIEVVVNVADEKRPINLTKLTASLTGSRQSFKHLIKHNKGFWAIIESYTTSKTAEDSVASFEATENNDSKIAEDLVASFEATKNNASETTEDLVVAFATTKNNDLQGLFDKDVLIFFNGQPSWRAGVYGPTWLADWIAINFKPEFFKQIHELFEVVEQVAELKKTTFEKELHRITAEKDREIERITGERDDLAKRFDDFREEARKRDEENKALLRRANSNIDELKGIVVRTAEHATEHLAHLSAQINESFPNAKMTHGEAKEIFIVLKCEYLTRSMREAGVLSVRESVFDTISCQRKDRSTHLARHHFNEETDEIVLELETSNSLDLEYFAKINLNDPRARLFTNKSFVRKLIYYRGYEDRLLDLLQVHAASVGDVRVEFIRIIQQSQAEIQRETRESLADLNQRLEKIEERLTALEKLAKLIPAGLNIDFPNRVRKLKTYLGRNNTPYVNIDKHRHYLTEDEANYALKRK